MVRQKEETDVTVCNFFSSLPLSLIAELIPFEDISFNRKGNRNGKSLMSRKKNNQDSRLEKTFIIFAFATHTHTQVDFYHR